MLSEFHIIRTIIFGHLRSHFLLSCYPKLHVNVSDFVLTRFNCIYTVAGGHVGCAQMMMISVSQAISIVIAIPFNSSLHFPVMSCC